MERNYLLLMGFFLLLVAVDCSSSDLKGNVNEKTGLNQNLEGTVDLVEGNDDSESVLGSSGIKNVKYNGGDQINGSTRDIGSDTNQSYVRQKSGEGEKLLKDGKDSHFEARGMSDGGKGDNEQKGMVKSHDDAGGKAGGGQGDNEQKGKEESHVDAGGKTDGGKGDNERKGKEESHVETKGKVDGEKADKEHKGQESNVKSKGMTNGVKEGDNEKKGLQESNVESKGMTAGIEGNNEQKGQEESILETKGKTDGGVKEGDNVQKGLGESKLDDKGKTEGEKEGNNAEKSQDGSKLEAKGKMDGEKKGKTDGGKKGHPDNSEDLKQVKSEKVETQDLVPPPPPPTWKDGFRSEECDPSNMCMDKNKRFVACLRVPGNESPDLSLLIKNKGDEPLTIKISAPDFVQLEETNVEIQEKQDKEVKVSIKSSGIGNLIVLKDGNGECSLDFNDLIVHNSATSYVNFLSQTPTTAFIFLATIMILASGWMCMSVRRRIVASDGLKYQRLEMELPVSVAAKAEQDVSDGWDNSWGDDWDDEEASMTPSMPVTPSLSSKGLASRRLSKEG